MSAESSSTNSSGESGDATGGRYVTGQRTSRGSGGPDDAAPGNASDADESMNRGDGGGSANAEGNSQSPPPGAQPGSSAVASQSAGGSPSAGAPQGGPGGSSTSAGDSDMAATGTPVDLDVNQQFNRERSDNTVVPNFSTPRKNVRAVAVRRPIRVVVRGDHVGLVSDESRAARRDLTGKTIPFEGDTVESMQEFVKAVEQQVDGWGIAGNNLYWRPVLEIQVGPDGQRRAEEMVRLLKNSDLEVQLPATATQIPQGAPRATR
jgi:hypothetical protein